MADVVDLIGSFGRWQGFLLAFVSYRGIITGFNNLAYVFLVTNNDHWCSHPDKQENMTEEEMKKIFIPYDNTSDSYSQCLMYDVPLNGTSYGEEVGNVTTVPCESWAYEEHVFGHSISNEWDLVCDRQWQKSLVQSSYMACLMVGVILIGNLSDRYGRRIVILWSSMCLGTFSVACVFSNSFYFFLATRVGIAFGISGLQVACFTLLAETIGPRSRIALNICYGYGWILGILLLPGIVWLVGDWRKLQITNAVFVLSTLVMLPWVYESPRWLLSTGQTTKACESIKKIASFNRRATQDIEKEVERLMEHKVGIDKSVRVKVSTIELFKTKYLRRNTILLFSGSFFSYIVYYGSARSSTTLGGNPFFNFAISAVVEFVGYTISLATTKYVKRVPIMAVSYGFFGNVVRTCMSFFYVLFSHSSDLSAVRITIRMMGWLLYTLGFTTQFVYINEVFPTVARSGAFGLCTTVGRLGATLEPWIYIVMLSWGDKVVLIIYSAMILGIAALVTLLPETFGSVLSDTLEEGERFSESKLSKRKRHVQDHAGYLEAYKKVPTEEGEAEIKF
ncbi:unnamed protein product [Ixodes hexagonus]